MSGYHSGRNVFLSVLTSWEQHAKRRLPSKVDACLMRIMVAVSFAKQGSGLISISIKPRIHRSRTGATGSSTFRRWAVNIFGHTYRRLGVIITTVSPLYNATAATPKIVPPKMTHPSLLFSPDLNAHKSSSSSWLSPKYSAPMLSDWWWTYENWFFSQQSGANVAAPQNPESRSLYTPEQAHLATSPYSHSHCPLPPSVEFDFIPQNLISVGGIDPMCYSDPEDCKAWPAPGWSMSGTRSSNPWDVYNSALGADGHAAPSTASSHQTLSSPSALPFLLTFSSPSSSTSSSSVPSSVSRTNRSPASSRRSSVDTTPRVKTCSNCGTLTTPLWRRNRETNQPLCNACGLYLQLRSKMRPAALIAADLADDEAAVPGAPQCFNCHAQSTSVWRRSKTGAKLCNACGLYARLRGRDRPLSLNRNKIRPRGRHPQT